MKTQKQATRGQELIFKENQETLLFYGAASLIGSGLFFVTYYFLFEASWKVWTVFGLSVVGEVAAFLIMKSGVRANKDSRGKIIDAGSDLNNPEGVAEYCKDVIILSVITQVVSLLSTYFLSLLLAFPIYAFYKLWVLVIAPWIFAEPPEQDELDEKKARRQERKQQKVVYRR